MLTQEMMSMVMSQKWRKPTMSTRVRMTVRKTMVVILRLVSRTNTTKKMAAIARPIFRHNSYPIISSVSQAA